MIKNKRGDVALTLLTIFTFIIAVSFLALFVYEKLRSSYALQPEISEMMNEAENGQQYILSEMQVIGFEAIPRGGDVKSYFQEVASARAKGVRSFGNFFEKIKNGEFEIVQDSPSWIFRMNGVEITVRKGANEITRKFDINEEINPGNAWKGITGLS